MSPIPIHIGLPGGIRQLRIEKLYHAETLPPSYNNEVNCWMIWLSANKDFTLGTFIRLGHNGTIDRVTVHPDGTESIFNLIEEIDHG